VACSLRSTLSLCRQFFRYSAFIAPTLLPVCTRDLRLFVPSPHPTATVRKGRGFAFSFLQIPPRGGHPCLQLTVPTAKPVADFHRQVIDRARRT
jgi:hypothetical protein